jgi:hypothetical protein
MDKFILIYLEIFHYFVRVLFIKLKNFKFFELLSFFKMFLMTAIWKVILSRGGYLCVTYKTGFGLDSWIY